MFLKNADTTSLTYWVTCPDCGFYFSIELPYNSSGYHFDIVICPNCGSTF